DYSHQCFHHEHHSSGMIIYVHHSLHLIHRPDLSTAMPSATPSMLQTFQLYHKTDQHTPSPLLITFGYIHPAPSDAELKTITTKMNELNDTGMNVIITGDLNSR